MKARQRGVALITVLLVLGLALLIVGALLRGHRLLLQSTALQVHQVQMRQWALSAEALAREQVRRGKGQTTVHGEQGWARSGLDFEVPGGEVRIAIEDLGGRLNLSGLLTAGRVDAELERRWERLLQQQALPPVSVDAWQSADVFDASRIRLLPGYTQRQVRALEPLMALLPVRTALNLNTATAPVLASLGMPPSVVVQVVAQRPAQGYESVQAFLQQPLLARLDLNGHGLTLDSTYFRVTVRVTLGDRRLRWVSDLKVEPQGEVRVIRRRVMVNEYSL